MPTMEDTQDRTQHTGIHMDRQEGAHGHGLRDTLLEPWEALNAEVDEWDEHECRGGEPQHATRETAGKACVAVDIKPEGQHQEEYDEASDHALFALVHGSGLHLDVSGCHGLAGEDVAVGFLLGIE